MALELFSIGATFTVTDAELVDGGDTDTTYTVRYFTADDADRLRKAATKRNVFDPMVYALSILDYVILDWDGITNDGQPLPCVLEHKKLLPAGRRERLLQLAQENVQVKAAAQADSFRETP